MSKKTTAAEMRATNKYRSKTVKKEITINPDNHPRLADWINDEQYKITHRSFNQFAIDLIEQHLDSETDNSAK